MKQFLALLIVLSFVLLSPAHAATVTQAQINNLQIQIDQLKQSVARSEIAITNLQNAQATTNASLAAVQTLIQQLQTEVASMKLQIADINAKLTATTTPPPPPPPTEEPPPPPPATAECSDGTVINAGQYTAPIVLKDTKYCVKGGDVHADFTAFSAQASNITLDCGGHAVYYGEKKPYSDTIATTVNSSGATVHTGADRVYGILGTACYGAGVYAYGSNPCGGTFENLTVQNCRIVQKGGGPFSHNIRLGQGGGSGMKLIKNTFEHNGNSAHAVWAPYTGGHDVHSNTFAGAVQKIQSRHQLDGVQVKFTEGSGKAPNLVYDNVFLGSVQGGVVVTSGGSKVYRNKCSLNSYYTNDFCIYLWGGNQQAYENEIDNTQGTNSGRGIQVAAPDALVFNNVAKVRELPRNAEYNGCEAGGAYGIQLEKGAVRAKVYGNDFTALANACDGIAFRVSGGTVGSLAETMINNNQARALRETSTAPGKAFLFSGRGIYGATLKDMTTAVASTACFHDVSQLSTEPPSDVSIENVTCTKDPTNPASTFTTWYMDNYGGEATYRGVGLQFNGMSGLEIKSWAVGQPTSLMHRRYDIYINNLKHLFNTTTQAVVIE